MNDKDTYSVKHKIHHWAQYDPNVEHKEDGIICGTYQERVH